MYINLLQAISSNDLEKIGKLTERNLYREFNAGIQQISTEVSEIQVLNKPEDKTVFTESTFKIDVIDYQTTFGAYINRDENRQYGVKPVG